MSSTEVVTIGLVGCGAIASKHVDAIANLSDVRLVAVSDKNEARRTEIASRTGAASYGDYEDMLSRKDLDAVIIATPSGLHASMALQALDAGKHVLVEKPMAMTVEEADRMIECARVRRRVLSVVHHNRFNDASRILKESIENGHMGRLLWGSTSVRWFRPQDYYSASGWRGTAAMDGGVLMNQAIHHIDLLLWLVGDIESFAGFRRVLGHEMEAEDTAVLALQFKNGALGAIDATTCAYPKNLEETVTVIGERGSVIMGGATLNDFRAWRVDGIPQTASVENRPRWYGHYRVIEDFVRAIRSGTKPAVDGTEGRRAVEFITRVYAQTHLE